jgi:hypothetical protein
VALYGKNLPQHGLHEFVNEMTIWVKF